jgi:hypothetical protein
MLGPKVCQKNIKSLPDKYQVTLPQKMIGPFADFSI